jgi:hypothetical protein
MSQQGEKPTGHDDDWWGQLYDDSTEDTGPAAVADSLDDRFASAAGTVGAAPRQGPPGGETAGAPPPSGPPDTDAPHRSGLRRERAPWEAPPSEPPAPVSFPPGPKPPGFRAEAPLADTSVDASIDTSIDTSIDMSTETLAAAVPASRAPADGPAGEPAPGLTGRPTEDPPATLPDAPSDTPPGTPPGTSTGTSPDAPSGPLPDAPAASAPAPATAPAPARITVDYVGSGPPTYDPEPTALPPADPDDLDDLVADTVLDGAQYGTCTLRAASVRGDSARYRGEPRRDSLLTARFGTGEQALVLVAMATGARATPGAHRAAAEACQWIGRAVGRSHARLAEDIKAARRGDLKSGLHRLTDRSLGKLRATAAEQGIDPEEYTASLRCLLLPADTECRTRVFFGIGAGGLFRLRDGEWQDIEPHVADATGEAVVGFGSPPSETPEGDRLTMDLGITTPPSPYEPAPEPPREPFRFRASVARPGDTLLLCSGGLAEPLRGEPGLARQLTARWADADPPGLAAFLADVQVRVKGYADDRTAAAVWET